MSRRRPRAPARSPFEWAVRGGLALTALAFGFYGVTFSLAQAVAAGSPAIAHRLAPYDGRVTARLASSIVEGDPSVADRARADRLARRALYQDPTAVVAVSTLGLNAEARGDKVTARRYFTFAEKLSRRDLATQLWGVEDAAGRGDIDGALRRHDIALRVRPELAELLFPVLAAASADPAIRSALVRTLRSSPGWQDSFLQYVSVSEVSPESTAQLFSDLRRVGVLVSPAAQAAVVNALVISGKVDQGWHYYASIRSGAQRQRLRDPDFIAAIGTPSMLDWAPINNDGIVTSMQDGLFEFAIPASVGGGVLQQTQLLSPGTYRIGGRSSGIEQSPAARPYWALLCRADGRELGRVVLPNSSQAGGRYAGVLNVPSDCPVQSLILMAQPVDTVGGLVGQLTRVELAPLK